MFLVLSRKFVLQIESHKLRVECKSPYYYLCGMTKCNCIIACIIDDQHHVINAIEHEQSIVVDRLNCRDLLTKVPLQPHIGQNHYEFALTFS